MIKVIGGKYRSRNLFTPDEGTLPTKNMVRGAIMSALHQELDGAHVLDLFAGSGALGIDALSQGASSCVFVDVSKSTCGIIQKNLQTLKEEHGRVECLDYRSFLDAYHGMPFDIVFLDPPYALKEAYQNAVDTLLQRDLLSPNAAIMLEYEGDIEIDDSKFKERRDYKYGKTKVIILRRPL